MAVLTLRIDDETHKRLKDAAKTDNRSLNGEIEWMLLSMLDLKEAGKLETP